MAGMAKHHQLLSSYQQGIVRRFFAHRDTTLRRQLAELVSEIYVATSEKSLEKLWKSARETMARAGADAADIESVCTGRKVEELARIVSEFERPSAGSAPPRPKADPFGGDERF